MEGEFEIESEVREIGCKREKCCHTCTHADSSICDIAGEVSCSNYALSCKDYKDRDLRHVGPPNLNADKLKGELENVEGNVSQAPPPQVDDDQCWALELAWLFGLMPDKHLIKTRDVISFRVDKEEYYRNPNCKISCGTMRYVMKCIDGELKWRRENNVQIAY